MWRPPQRIKWKADPGDWPSREAAADSALFSPLDVGRLQLRQRTWVPAMVPWRATDDGFVTPDVLAWYERFAQGKPGAIVVEATGIRDIPSGPLMRIGDDRFIPGLTELVETVDRASDGETKLFIQLIDFLSIRRRPDPAKFFAAYLAITPDHKKALGLDGEGRVRARLAELDDEQLKETLSEREFEQLRLGDRERVTDLDLPHVRDLPETLPGLFADAAGRAKIAGFDGVELHYAHAYTMASFLSALNTRDDGYGGDRESRARLPLEVFQAVRDRLGDYVVGCRFLSDEIIEGGNRVDDAAYFGACFAKAGFDFLSLSRGGKFEDAKVPAVGAAVYPYTGPSGYECMPQFVSDEQGPFGRNVEPVAAIRSAVRQAGCETPVVVAGGFHGFEQAERVLRAGQADIIAFARQSLADPDWFRKVKQGKGDQVRLCVYTNYCEALDQKHTQVTCNLWDRSELADPDLRMTPDGKRRLTAPDWVDAE